MARKIAKKTLISACTVWLLRRKIFVSFLAHQRMFISNSNMFWYWFSIMWMWSQWTLFIAVLTWIRQKYHAFARIWAWILVIGQNHSKSFPFLRVSIFCCLFEFNLHKKLVCNLQMVVFAYSINKSVTCSGYSATLTKKNWLRHHNVYWDHVPFFFVAKTTYWLLHFFISSSFSYSAIFEICFSCFENCDW